ncbi:uncharacterized protein C2845_PM13G14460 [Panicum miliaceum]|uniref:Uncharacterized protein n=1 Tax=Panicum miliaceum TaxID=4540 RepID=A0A3L6RG03_PANMI|nr:uncharacterized protein C2845_PM13G14460 [Panicum miliaceum]
MRPTMLAPRSLRKAAVPPALLSDPKPGSLQPTRLAVHLNGAGSSCSAYLASGCRVYKIEISMDGAMLSKGKESLLIPDNSQVISSSVVDRCPHRSEIQSVALAEGEDSTNGVSLYAFAYYLELNVSAKVAVARQLCKSIDIYNQDIHVRSLRALWYPSSFSFVQCSPQVNESNSLLAIAEGSQLSIWDLRMNNSGGCVQRISGSIGDIIYSVCSSPSGPIAIGGTDRAVTIYDPRRWSALSRWVGCSKYEITGLSFSSVDQSFIYVQGVDYEITCGRWKESERAFSFRGNSNWLGFSKIIERIGLSRSHINYTTDPRNI